MRANIGNTPSISQMSVLEVLLCFICIGYHWESSDLSGEAERRRGSRTVKLVVIFGMNEGMMAGMGTISL